MKRLLLVACVLILAAVIWLVITDSDLVRSCEHRGGTVVEANGSVTCELVPSGQP